jgi:formylglycine-generating enzyme required for sulfatase activity
MNLKITTVMLCAAFSMSVLAVPEIREGSVSMVQDASRKVTITYTLDTAPAVVTVDILTNGVPLTGAMLQGRLTGAINCKVEPGTHTVSWRPRADDRIVKERDWAENAKAVVTAWPTNAPPTWMVVDLTKENAVEFYPDESWFPEPMTSRVYKTDKLVMRRISAANKIWTLGSYQYGSVGGKNYGEFGRSDNETARPVMLTDDYYIGVFEVTQAQYAHIKALPAQSWTDDSTLPVGNVRWKQELRCTGNVHYFWPRDGHAVSDTSFMGLLRARTGNIQFDLPTEAQWEIACRAGEGAAFNNGCMMHTNVVLVDEVAWVSNKNEVVRLHPVGLKKPNRWGLYDMHGNVSEYCLDLFPVKSPTGLSSAATQAHKAYFSNTDLIVDPVGPQDASGGLTSGEERSIAKGGAFNLLSNYARSACRYNPQRWYAEQKEGFRLCCPAAIP